MVTDTAKEIFLEIKKKVELEDLGDTLLSGNLLKQEKVTQCFRNIMTISDNMVLNGEPHKEDFRKLCEDIADIHINALTVIFLLSGESEEVFSHETHWLSHHYVIIFGHEQKLGLPKCIIDRPLEDQLEARFCGMFRNVDSVSSTVRDMIRNQEFLRLKNFLSSLLVPSFYVDMEITCGHVEHHGVLRRLQNPTTAFDGIFE